MRSVALLGDSILDNAPYTGPGRDTTTHLGRLLGPGWQVVRVAQDGATMADLPLQLARLDSRPDWAILSIGGNDAIAHLGLFDRSVRHATEVLEELLRIGDDFATRYRAALETVRGVADHLVLCTIYEPPLEPPPLARLARAPLALLNDWIIRIGAAHDAAILDLRSVCTDPEGIARAIAALLGHGPPLRSGNVLAI
jgi:lysophospholipase L1-like esterase